MIQFNLLPDVKIAYIKAERQKQLVISISTIASIAAIVLFVLLFSFVNIAQKKNMNDLTKDIKSKNADLMATKDLNKILTIQNQLGALDQLHGDKAESARIANFLEQVTPATVTINLLDIDFTAQTMSITGRASTIADVNTYADSLKFTKFITANDSEEQNAFHDVVLSSLKVSEKDGPEYTLTASYEPVLFAQDENVKLDVPKMITTRSNLERPESVFEGNGQ